MSTEATMTVGRVGNSGITATLAAPYNGGSCVFGQTYTVRGYERRHAVARAREVAALLGWTIKGGTGPCLS